jgi:adenosylcobyric acid synthase
MGDELGQLDALIIPGTRNTINDMVALNEAGFSDEIRQIATEIPLFGICGGYQILGEKIMDPSLKESKHGTVDGLGLLKVKTSFGDVKKIISQSQGQIMGNGVFKGMEGELITGYELHEGVTIIKDTKPLTRVIRGCGNHPQTKFDGAVQGMCTGTYFHGIFHNFNFRRFFTDFLRERNGLEKLGFDMDHFEVRKGFSLERLAEIFEENVDMEKMDKILGIES